MPDRIVHDRTIDFVPRSVTTVDLRTQYVTARTDVFLSTLRLQTTDIYGTGTMVTHFNYFPVSNGALSTISTTLGCRVVNTALWQVHLSKACLHSTVTSDVRLRLGSEFAPTNSPNEQLEGCAKEDIAEIPESICVLLMKDDSRAR